MSLVKEFPAQTPDNNDEEQRCEGKNRTEVQCESDRVSSAGQNVIELEQRPSIGQIPSDAGKRFWHELKREKGSTEHSEHHHQKA